MSDAVVFFVLLAAEVLTLLRIHALLNQHVFIGMLLVPPVLLKVGNTTWRFSRYYLGSPKYRRKEPPPVVRRLLGPVDDHRLCLGDRSVARARWKS